MPADVKICGLTTHEAFDTALRAGAQFVGLVFYPRSPRNVDLKTARLLAERARGRAKIVAVVVDATDKLISDIANLIEPDYFQAHGHEDPSRVMAITLLTGVSVIKAIKVDSAADIASAKAYRDAAAMMLFDASAPRSLGSALPGGNGLAFDWTLLSKDGSPKRFLLSGGLTATNVADAIRITGAPIVDVSSGVESSPGVKDPRLIRNFIEAARSAG